MGDDDGRAAADLIESALRTRALYTTDDVIATYWNPANGVTHELRETELRAVLAENARMREELEALPGMLVAAWRTGWAKRGQVVYEAMSRAEEQRGFFVEQFKARADEWVAELADAAPQQPARDTAVGGAE